MKIYTRAGDQGETSLFGGMKVPKNDPRVEAYGTVDELNSFIGMTIALGSLSETVKDILHTVQNILFNVGTMLATPNELVNSQAAANLPRISEQHIKWMEDVIDQLSEQLPPLKTFVIPGGHPGAAMLHVCRTICRRAERSVTTLSPQTSKYQAIILKFLNRLSDLFFVLARYVNWQNHVKDVPWEKKDNIITNT